MFNKPFKNSFELTRPKFDPYGVYTLQELLEAEQKILLSSGTNAIRNTVGYAIAAGLVALAEAATTSDPWQHAYIQAGLGLYTTTNGIHRVVEVLVADNNRTAIKDDMKNNPFELIPSPAEEAELFTIQQQ